MLARFLARALGRHETTELRLYTRTRCPLCDELKAQLSRARLRPRCRVVEIDVEGDPELEARHGRSVPVLELAGRALCKGRVELGELERRYARRIEELRSAPDPAAEAPDG